MNSFDQDLLPPKEFQIMNYSEANFKAIGGSHLDYFVESLGLKNTDHILEIGSGNGRISSALARFIDKGSYIGVDIMKPFVAWCEKAYKAYPNFSFKHVNIFNKHYNKISLRKAKYYKFPFPDNSFDFIFLTSVFTHMHQEDIDNYLSEIQRMLKPNAKCFITYFLIDSETLNNMKSGDSTRNFQLYADNAYTDNLKIPETAIAYDGYFIKHLYSKNNLNITHIENGKWRSPAEFTGVSHNQDRVIAVKG